MKITEKRVVPSKITEVILDVLCNKCGKTCRVGGPEGEYEGLIEVTVEGGYHSQMLGDMNAYTFSICEDCLVDIMDGFTIPYEHKDHLET